MLQQLQYFSEDIHRLLGKHKIRILHVWLSRVFWGLFLYRFERGMFLTFGRAYEYFRIILIPIYNLWQSYSNMDIHYKADIKGGLIVLHPSVGVVVSGRSIIGRRLTLTGGNIIGARGECPWGGLVIGDECGLGANAVILGPVKLGNRISIGASACVVNDCLEDGVSLVGVPAKKVVSK